jgi:hypothetical protein
VADEAIFSAAGAHDGIDNDGDESVDEGLMVSYYRDWDGEPNDSIIGSSSDGSYVPNDDDCDDADGATSPDAIEECDGEDKDCDEVVDDGECGPGDEYTAAHGGTMIEIDAQTLEVGCTAGMSSCHPDEVFSRDVTLTSDFYIGETEVTPGHGVNWILILVGARLAKAESKRVEDLLHTDGFTRIGPARPGACGDGVDEDLSVTTGCRGECVRVFSIGEAIGNAGEIRSVGHGGVSC